MEKYRAYSLVEMLITIVILGVVMLVVSATLIALVKASAISGARTLSRGESEFIIDVVQRNIQNSEVEKINVYSPPGRSIVNGKLVQNNNETQTYFDSSTGVTGDGIESGTEIQFRPVGSQEWVCIAFFVEDGAGAEGEDLGYVLKAESADEGFECMNPSRIDFYPVYLNNEEIDVNLFELRYYVNASGNYTFIVDLEVEPLRWIPGSQSRFRPEYRRQAVVSTDMLTL